MNEKQENFIKSVIESTDDAVYKLGEFEIRNDFGVNAYYKGKGGDVVIPDQLDDSVTLWFENVKKITSLHYPGSFKEVVHPNNFGSKDTVEKLIFDEGVTSISSGMGNTCFKGFKKLTDVQLPSTLTYLGREAFVNSPWYKQNLEEADGCYYIDRFLVGSDENIEKAEIREGTIMICNGAFKNRDDLTEVVFPSTLKTIDAMAFNNCRSLSSVTIPENVETIGAYAFTRCAHLTYVDVPDSCDVKETAFADKDPVFPEMIHLPISDFRKAQDQVLKDYFAICYLTCKDRYNDQEQSEFDEYVKSRRTKILPQLIENDHSRALKAALFTVDKKIIDSLIEKSQKFDSVSSTAVLLDWKNKS